MPARRHASLPPGEVAFRDAGPDDVEAVARLHAASWRASYRGILSDAFLDGPVYENRLEVWRDRLGQPATGRLRAQEKQFILLAEEKGALRGFVCAFLDEDAVWGAFLDNLHVVPSWQGCGLGRRLMSRAAAWVAGRRPGMGLYLLVFEKNRAARGFYDYLDGRIVESFPYRAPDGTDLIIMRYWWDNAGRFVNW